MINLKRLLKDFTPDRGIEVSNIVEEPNICTSTHIPLNILSQEYTRGFSDGFNEGMRTVHPNDMSAYLFGRPLDYWRIVADYIAETPNVEKYLQERFYATL